MDKKNFFLYGVAEKNANIVRKLYSNGEKVNAILTDSEEFTEKVWGIKIANIYSFKFSSETKNVLIIYENDYENVKNLLDNLNINLEIEIFSETNKINKPKTKLKQLVLGLQLYKNLRRISFEHIYIYNYSGLGDMYLFSLWLNEFNKINKQKIILIVANNGVYNVAKIFGLQNIYIYTQDEICALNYLLLIGGKSLNISNITPFSKLNHMDISNKMAGKRLNLLETYQYQMLCLGDSNKIKYPENSHSNIEEVKRLFKEKGLQHGNTVILSPYANTVVGYSKDFWEMLAKSLLDEGYSVCTNHTKKEHCINGTVSLNFELEFSNDVLEYAGFFIGIRSGFCDIICNNMCRKIILYPQHSIFNSDPYTFCSFENMNIGKNNFEIIWNYDKFEKLIKTIVMGLQCQE